ncbi:MAG: hypothetical protein R3A46_17705 [Thermomicrobiales bacterium]
MEKFGVTDFVQQERNRLAQTINCEGWKFEHIKQPDRGRLKLAMLRRAGIR